MTPPVSPGVMTSPVSWCHDSCHLPLPLTVTAPTSIDTISDVFPPKLVTSYFGKQQYYCQPHPDTKQQNLYFDSGAQFYKQSCLRTTRYTLVSFIFNVQSFIYFYFRPEPLYDITKMNLDVYTQHIPLTSKARFWGNFVSALKGEVKVHLQEVKSHKLG